MFITKKWILCAFVDTLPAPGLLNLTLNDPAFTSSSWATNVALSVALAAAGHWTVNNITESAWTVLFVTAKSASAAAFKPTPANVIIPDVALIVTPVLWLVPWVTVPLPACIIPLVASVICKLPASIEKFGFAYTADNVVPPIALPAPSYT